VAAKKLSAAVEATWLLGKWTKLAQGHVVFGAGCSCGVGFGNLQLKDFEPQILDYLKTKHGITGFAGIADILRSIATKGDAPGRPLDLLADLERSLESFEELHGGRRG
jgi:hypothetical protein